MLAMIFLLDEMDMDEPAKTKLRLFSLNVGSLLAFGALRYFKADLLAFLERFETVHVDCGKVSKQINATIIGRNKTEAFCVVKPFNCTDCHVTISLLENRDTPCRFVTTLKRQLPESIQSDRVQISPSIFDTGNFKTVITPATLELIACAVVSGAITVVIAFLHLDGFDQFGFEKVVWIDAERFGNLPYFRYFHGRSPFSGSVCCSLKLKRSTMRVPLSQV
jgi:hypothetical protein